MPFALTKNILREIVIAFASLYLLVAIFGVNFGFASGHMETESQCVSITHGANLFCPLSAIQQITDWQARFASIMNYFSFAILFLLVVALYLGKDFRRSSCYFSKKFYRRRQIILRPLYLWSQLFSAGILNPKLF